MGYTVRPAQESDAEQAAALLNRFIEEGRYTILTEKKSAEDEREIIRLLSARGVYNVAIDDRDQAILGVQVVFPYGQLPAFDHVGDIGTYVDPNAHRSGVGRALAEYTFERSKEVGFRKIIAMIRGDNHRALEFYRRIGFGYIGLAKQQACVRGVFLDEVLMEKLLD